MAESIDSAVLQRFRITRQVGRGAYGAVFEANPVRSPSERCAIKKCFGCFQNITDAQRIYREVWALMSLSHPNMVELFDVVLPSLNSQDLYLVTEYLPIDLGSAIKTSILSDHHRPFITYQILNGLVHMHSRDLVHRDIKPSNILLDSSCRVKLCDLGLVRFMGDSSSHLNRTDYVATRWYRAPEIMLGSNTYSFPVDIWATGTVVAEMYLGRQLFAGTSPLNQLERIIELTGFPSDEDLVELGGMSRLSILQNISKTTVVRPIAELIPNATYTILDLLRQMLKFSPSSRVSAQEAIRHGAFCSFTKFHPISDIATFRMPVDVEVTNVRLSPNDYKILLCNEIENWRMHAQKNSFSHPEHDKSITGS